MKPKDQFHFLSPPHHPLTRQPGVTRRHVSRGLTCGETRHCSAATSSSPLCDVCYDHCAPNDQSIIASFTLLSTHHHHHHPSTGRDRDGCIASYRLSWPRVNAGLSSFLRLPRQLLLLTPPGCSSWPRAAAVIGDCEECEEEPSWHLATQCQCRARCHPHHDTKRWIDL